MFYCCFSLSYIELPKSLYKIDYYALCSTNLTSIMIPEKVSFIGENALGNNICLKTVTFLGIVDPYYKNAFSGTNINVVYVTKQYLNEMIRLVNLFLYVNRFGQAHNSQTSNCLQNTSQK